MGWAAGGGGAMGCAVGAVAAMGCAVGAVGAAMGCAVGVGAAVGCAAGVGVGGGFVGVGGEVSCGFSVPSLCETGPLLPHAARAPHAAHSRPGPGGAAADRPSVGSAAAAAASRARSAACRARSSCSRRLAARASGETSPLISAQHVRAVRRLGASRTVSTAILRSAARFAWECGRQSAHQPVNHTDH